MLLYWFLDLNPFFRRSFIKQTRAVSRYVTNARECDIDLLTRTIHEKAVSPDMASYSHANIQHSINLLKLDLHI